MKKFFQMVAFASLTLAMTACYNDDDLWNKVDELETKVEANASDIAALSALVDALNNGKIIVGTQQTENGYVLTFNDGSQVSVLNGKDGADGKDGELGANGDSFFTSIEETDDIVIITLADGRVIKLPKALDYELRVLTFEDEDCNGEELGDGKYKWSEFIPTGGQYGSGHAGYWWGDYGNTELEFTPVYGMYGAFAGHAGISNYVGTDWENQGNYMYDLQAYNVTGGHSGSNFNTHFGYVDESGYGMNDTMPSFYFWDGEARVIDHMWVTNTTYVYNQLQVCTGFGANYTLSDSSTFKIVAYGYESDNDKEPTTAEFYLLNTGKQFVTEWTKWDLSVLGKVVKVEFNLVGSDDMYGSYGFIMPAYFAYDDVAVRFEK